MSKRKVNVFNSLGEIYGDILNRVQTVTEAVKPGEIGEAPLIPGGPTERGGFSPAAIDRRKLSDKEKQDNLYNINKLSEEDEEEHRCKHAEEGCDCDECEDCRDNQKNAPESIKKESKSLNNFMSKKSVFDRLYENVMGGTGGFKPSEDAEDANDLEALNLGDDTNGDTGGEDLGEEDTVTLTMDRETAAKLHDMLSSVLGDEEDGMEGEDEFGGEEGEGEGGAPFGEEDEEELGHGGPGGTATYNDGKNNKVGNLKVSSGGAASKVTDKVGADGELGHAGPGGTAKYVDGKNNKVGSLKVGKSAFEQ